MPRVRLAPGDDGVGLPSVILSTNPARYTPRPNKWTGVYSEAWGVPTCEDEDSDDEKDPSEACQVLFHRAQMKFAYMNAKLPLPQEQFCSYFKEKALAEIAKVPAEWKKRDYTIRIKMLEQPAKDSPRLRCLPDDEDLVMRLVRVSGGMNLHTFTDKVVLPLIGFCRNYHSYYYVLQAPPFTSVTPLNAGSVDSMHQEMRGFAWLDAGAITVAELFPAQRGPRAVFFYDLGDMHPFMFQVDGVARVEESTGKVAVLEGRGPAPPEDSWGFKDERNFSLALRKGKVNAHKAEKALNYNGQGGRARETFDPSKPWDKARYTAEVHAALGKLSDTPNPKTFSMPMSPHGFSVNGDFHMQEGTREGPDPKKAAACAICGRVDNLKLCSRCKELRYCSQECQAKDWPRHKQECSSKK